MRLSSLLPVGVSLLANMVAAADSDVIDLTAGTFEQEVMNEKLALVEFFAPWVSLAFTFLRSLSNQ